MGDAPLGDEAAALAGFSYLDTINADILKRLLPQSAAALHGQGLNGWKAGGKGPPRLASTPSGC